MSDRTGAVPYGSLPWGNLWRTAVTTHLFFLAMAMPIAALTTLDEGTSAPGTRFLLYGVAAAAAGYVVWSDDVDWIGDPSR